VIEDKADDKDERKKIQVLADEQRERDLCVRLSLQEQRLALRSLKRRVVPTIVQEKKEFFHGLNGVPYTPAAPAPKKPVPKKATVKKELAKKPPAKKQKAPLSPAVLDAVLEESKFERAAPPEEGLVKPVVPKNCGISPSKRRRRKPTKKTKVTPILLKVRKNKLTLPCMNRLILRFLGPIDDVLWTERKKRNDLWDLRRDAAREMDPETRRDLYAEADAALYEAIRVLKMREDNAAARKAELATRAQEKLGRTVVLRDELDEKHQESSEEPSVESVVPDPM